MNLELGTLIVEMQAAHSSELLHSCTSALQFSTLLSAASLLHSYTPKRTLPPTLLKGISLLHSLKKILPPKEIPPTHSNSLTHQLTNSLTFQGPLGGLPFLCNFFGSPHWFLSRRICIANHSCNPCNPCSIKENLCVSASLRSKGIEP